MVRPILCDNNLSALPADYQDYIVERYKFAGVPLLDVNSGFEPRTFDEEVFKRCRHIIHGPWRFALDDQGDLPHVVRAQDMLREQVRNSSRKRVYVLIGNEPFESCMERIRLVLDRGAEPHVQSVMKLNAAEKRPVLLNRAPTLHRLRMQAFYPRLVEDKVIRLHPMVCTSFNADFDGDQMAVHIPLSPEAVTEAEGLMLSHWNLLSPSSGEAISAPTLDVVLGVWYATVAEEASGDAPRFMDTDDALRALEMGVVGLREPVLVRMKGEMVETTCGRILFNRTAPPEAGIEYINDVVGKGRLGNLTIEVYEALGNVQTARFLDALKDFGFGKVTESGISMSVGDIKTPTGKEATIAAAAGRVEELRENYYEGIITEEVEYLATLDVWNEAVDSLTDEIKDNLADYGGVYMMAESGAKTK